MIDLHVHTNFSVDSGESMEAHCQRAADLRLKAICFTDHLDNNKRDYGYNYYNRNGYFEALERVREKFGSSLLILSGIEFSEPHIYEKSFEETVKYPYDYIIGSLHYWYEDLFPSEMVKNNIPVEEAFYSYWNEMEKLVKYGGFDAVGHFDFPKRYYKSAEYDVDVIKELMKLINKNNLVLEINTSSIRKGLDEPMPGRELLKLYADCGNTRVTVGSDAHSKEELSADMGAAEKLAEDFGLKTIYFKNRKPVSL